MDAGPSRGGSVFRGRRLRTQDSELQNEENPVMANQLFEVKVYPLHGAPFNTVVSAISGGEALRMAKSQYPDARSYGAPRAI